MTQQQIDYEKGLRDFLERAFRNRMPALIEFSIRNQTVIRLLQHLRRHATGSVDTAYQYCYACWRYHLWANSQPDQILTECWDGNGDVLPKMLRKHEQLVDDFVGHLREQDLAPGTVANYAKGVKRLYWINGLKLDLRRYPRTVQYPDHSPKPEQLRSVMSIASVRERAIVCLIALGGFRASTAAALTYGHVRDDLENMVAPIMVRIRPKETKGQYCAYYSFLPSEAVGHVKAYLDERRRGSEKVPAENITDRSPLIRNDHSHTIRHVTPGAIWRTIHRLYVRAGVIPQCKNWRQHKWVENKQTGAKYAAQCELCEWPENQPRRYDVRVHSLRWYFRTQLGGQGVNPDFIWFWMGHKQPSYNDVASLEPEKLRAAFAEADFGIAEIPKPSTELLRDLTRLVKKYGADLFSKTAQGIAGAMPKDSFSEPNRTIVSPAEKEGLELLRSLAEAVRQGVIRDLYGPDRGEYFHSSPVSFDAAVQSPPGYHLASTTLGL